jgi:hypothetical protein
MVIPSKSITARGGSDSSVKVCWCELSSFISTEVAEESTAIFGEATSLSAVAGSDVAQMANAKLKEHARIRYQEVVDDRICIPSI